MNLFEDEELQLELTPSLSNETQKKIDKIISDEIAQKGRTWGYWKAMRTREPQKYFSPKMTEQRMKDAEALGGEAWGWDGGIR